MKVIYLHGFASSPASNKARFFAERLRGVGVEVTIPDLAGGDFEHLTISGQLQIIEESAGGAPVTLIGSSMGGYLAALYAARHPEVERLVLLAPAFCFARRWPDSLGAAEMESWRKSGTRMVFHYGEARECRLSYGLIRDGLLYENYPEVTQPTLIVHGMRDDVVPASLSQQFSGGRAGVKLVLVDSGHELTEVLDRLWTEVCTFLDLPSGGPAQPESRHL
jgi:hypothetical protein